MNNKITWYDVWSILKAILAIVVCALLIASFFTNRINHPYYGTVTDITGAKYEGWIDVGDGDGSTCVYPEKNSLKGKRCFSTPMIESLDIEAK